MTLPAAELGDEQVRELLVRAQAADPGALEWLYREYANRSFRYLYGQTRDRSLAEDITADVFARCPERLRSFEVPSRDVLPRFTAWWYRVLRNQWLDWVRRANREAELLAEVGRSEPVPVGRALERTIVREEMRQALETLTDEQREVVVLRFYEELSLAEVAELTDKTVEAVKGLQKRALAALGRELKRERR